MTRACPLLLTFCTWSSAACTQSEGEVGVYVSPSNGGPDGAVIKIPHADARAVPPDVARAPCEPGRYDGTFSCNLAIGVSCSNNPGMGGLVWTGPLSLTLQASGEFLAVTGGTLNASSGGYSLNGPLDGRVDCPTKQLTGSFDGTYTGPAL